MARHLLVVALALSLALPGCVIGDPSAGGDGPGREDRGEVAATKLREASGLVASRLNPGVLWAHNDSGDKARLFAMTTSGAHLGTFELDDADHVDWEDIAVGPGPEAGRSYLYVGDIGDNDADRRFLVVYRVPEPTIDADAGPVEVILRDVRAIGLRYPGGATDAETLLVDPLTGDLYVVTKRSLTVQVLRAAAPHALDGPVEMERVATLTFDEVPQLGRKGQGAVGGDIAPSGLAVLVKSYDAVRLWRRTSGAQPLFAGEPQRLPYVIEPQGEAIAWAADGAGYFTLSEERGKIPAHLYYYPLPGTP